MIIAAGGDTSQPLNLAKRIRRIAESIQISGSSILDCGCGQGEYVTALNSLGAEAVGVEYLPHKIEKARESGLTEAVVRHGDAENLEFQDGVFDAVLFNEVLEHIPNDRKALEEAYRTLKPGGHLILFAPNRLYPFETHGVHLKKGAKKVPVWMPFIPYIPLWLGNKFLNYWARNYWPGELRALVSRTGFVNVQPSYVWQTFEGIADEGSGTTNWMKPIRPTLRYIAGMLESCPGLRRFGVSQFIHARKPAVATVSGDRNETGLSPGLAGSPQGSI